MDKDTTLTVCTERQQEQEKVMCLESKLQESKNLKGDTCHPKNGSKWSHVDPAGEE